MDCNNIRARLFVQQRPCIGALQRTHEIADAQRYGWRGVGKLLVHFVLIAATTIARCLSVDRT
jgi:hypothetical protein